MSRRAILLFALSCLAWNAYAQQSSVPLSLRCKDVAKLVTEAPPAYIRESFPDSYRVGLFNKAGKELLGPHYFNVGNYDTGVALYDNVLFLSDTLRREAKSAEQAKGLESVGAYSRAGELLYDAFIFDNGPDYFAEGRQRFVYNGKMGFVNRLAEVTVPARYNWIDPYRNGVAYACLDCVYTVLDSNDKEHCCGFVGSIYELIDKAGNVQARKQADKQGRIDFRTPAPRISLKEAALAGVIAKNPVVRGVLREFGDTGVKRQPVCYDVPSRYSPYYHIAFVDTGDFLSDDFQFLISPDGRRILHLSAYTLTPETLAAWKRYKYTIYRQ